MESSTFSRIATHLGDVDNDPCTPVSNASEFSSSGSNHNALSGITGAVAALTETLFRGGSMASST